MKVFKILNSRLEAHMTTDLLKEHGVDAMLRGSREYASVITGTDLGRYEILVPEEQHDEAKKIIGKLNLQSVPEEHSPDSIKPLKQEALKEKDHGYYLKVSVIFAILGLVGAPFVFNLVSLWALMRFWRVSPNKKPLVVKVVFLIALNLLGMALGVWVILSQDLTLPSFLL